MKNLKYRVYTVSSQNQQFPARNLQDLTGIWQSQHNCPYPQQLTVQFFVPIQTKNMKIMFHQYKIPKLIQVFIKCRKQQKYRKLGLIQPNDNTQSNYLQKQIKTVFFEFPCTFIKLVFHQNYRNQMNLFDQIAISQLNFEGEILPTSQYKNLDINILDSLDTSSNDSQNQNQNQTSLKSQNKQLPQLRQQKKVSQSFTSLLYPQIFQKLQNAKLQAVQKQQFQKAQYIKNSILNFQQMQKQILKLQELKKIALNQQDYDKCHKLKIQITKKKQIIAHQIKQFQNQIIQNNVLTFSRANQAQAQQHNQYQQQQQNKANFITQRQNRLQTQQRVNRTPAINRNVSPNNNNNFHQYDSQVVPALRNKKNIQQSYMSSVAKQNQSILDTLRSPTTQKKQQYQQVQQSVDLRTYDINRLYEQFPKLQQLQFKKYKKYQPFFDYIRIDLWRMIFSDQYQKYWKLKSMALDQVMNLQIVQGKNLIAIMEFVAVTICDKHTINVKKSLQILQKLINMQNKDIWCDPNYPRYFVDTILTTLIQLMNDTKQQFRKLSIQIYKNLPQFSLVYLQTSIRTLIKTSPSLSSNYPKNKRKSNPRVQLSKLQIIQYYLSTFTDVMHHLTQIIKWLAQCTTDGNSDIKTMAIQILLDIGRMDKQLYNKIKKQLQKFGKDIWNSYQIQYNVLMNQIENSRMIDKVSSSQNQESIDIYKKQTTKPKYRDNGNRDRDGQNNRDSKDKYQSNVSNIQNSRHITNNNNNNSNISNMINIKNSRINQNDIYSINNTNRQNNSQIELAYSQQSGSRYQQEQSHDWFTNNNSNNNGNNNNINNLNVNNFQTNQSQSISNPSAYRSNITNNNNNNKSAVNSNYNNNKSNVSNNNSSNTYTNSNNNNSNLNLNKQIRVMQPYQDQLQGMCDYCFRKYDDPTLNQHLLKTCPAVLTCRHCKAAIYIRQYTQHLLTACIKKHQQCPRCLLAYQFDQINQHIARKICRKYRINMERCAFCQEDIQPEDIQWVQHCQKCQKIVRNTGQTDREIVYTENSEHMDTDR